jgi:hypothetical protein
MVIATLLGRDYHVTQAITDHTRLREHVMQCVLWLPHKL